MALFDYLEVYNQRRRHSTLGQISPPPRTTCRRSLDRDVALGSHGRTPDADPNAAERL
jgi:hypothetical protein